jgi:hypothetical protein
MQAAYDAAFDAPPKPLDQMLWHLFALCHRSFLTAIGTIARGQPDEAGAVSRRALEMAKVAIAVKHDPANADAWAAYDERLARWKLREQGGKPSPIYPKLTYPEKHALLEQIRSFMGMLSDSEVHFTPEFLGQQKLERLPEHLLVPYFVTEPADIDQAARLVASSHVLVLQAFDEAFGRTFAAAEPFRQAMHTLSTTAQRLATTHAQASAPTTPAAKDGEATGPR